MANQNLSSNLILSVILLAFSGCGTESKGTTPKTFSQVVAIKGTYKLIANRCDNIDSSMPTFDTRILEINDTGMKETIDDSLCKASLQRSFDDMTNDRIKTKLAVKSIQGCQGRDLQDRDLIYSYAVSGAILKLSTSPSDCVAYKKS